MSGRVRDEAMWKAIEEMYYEYSFSEIAAKVGCSRTTVARVVRLLGLRRSPLQSKTVMSKAQHRLVESERVRVVMQIPQRTSKNVVSKPVLCYCRKRLRERGYIVDRGGTEVLIPSDISRHRGYEARGMLLGLHFVEEKEMLSSQNIINENKYLV